MIPLKAIQFGGIFKIRPDTGHLNVLHEWFMNEMLHPCIQKYFYTPQLFCVLIPYFLRDTCFVLRPF